jgi:diguanylate cyclase (GGDEF)-like protein/PAS domain S-box-containing protein
VPKKFASSVALPTELPVLAVLGITDPRDGDWGRVRGLQFVDIHNATVTRAVTQTLASVATTVLVLGAVPLKLILAWHVALAITILQLWRTESRLAHSDLRRVSREETKGQAVATLANGLVWIAPLAVFGPFVDPDIAIKFWSVLALLMTASAVLLPAVPMATSLFLGLLALSSIAYFLFHQMWDMAVLAIAFGAICLSGATFTARRFLLTKIAQAGAAEKDEVVSLLLREFEEGDADWLWQTDTSRRIRFVSPRLAYALGMVPYDIEGMPFIQLIAGETWESGQFSSSLHDLAEHLKRRESFSNLLVRVTVNGEPRWWELSGTPKLDDNGVFDGFRGVGSDVTEARENSDKIAYMARYDTLTGLPNRMMLTEALGEALEHAEKFRTRCAFLMIDLDRFKAVNDTLGHLVGDQLLARVSERLRDQLSDNELCGRLGGDEFAIVIRDASDLTRVNRVAERIIARLSQPYEVDHHTLFVGASVGSAIGPRDGGTVETVMRNADLALYRSKDDGGGQHYVYEPSLHAHAEERRQLESSLRRALDAHEFALTFQPVVDAIDESVVSFEALLRWNSKDHGHVSPTKFIPLAEDTRLIVPIGEWVLRKACEEAVNWPDRVRVAVNVSGEQLLDTNFAPSVVAALSASGLPARRLEIEVTESIFLRDATMARSALEQVMALGCGVALDDFGTGYSSLGYLRKLRFSTIKVDRSFVQGAAGGNPESLAIIRAVVAMADSLEMSTTAEGVENAEELAIVRRLGCRKIQGYHFGRPMTAAEALKLFRKTDPPMTAQSA